MRIRRPVLALLLIAPAARAQDPPAAAPGAPAIRELKDEDVQVRRGAALAIRSAGRDVQRDALPVLIERLGSEKDGQVRLAVLDALTALGPDAAPAVPALLETLRTDYGGQSKEELHQDYRSALALAAIGEPAVEGLRGLLDERKVNVRAEAAMALGRIGPAASAAVPELVLRLADSSDRVGREAAQALGRIGTAAVGPLAETADDRRDDVRSRAVEALGLLVADARARDVVLERARDESPKVRAAALKSLIASGLPDEELAPIAEAGLSDEHEEVRLAAVNLLRTRRTVLASLAPRLESLLTAEDEGVARHAAFLLGALGPESAPALVRALARDGARIEPIAAELARLGRPAADRLTRALRDDDPRIRRGAALALGQVRPLPPGAVEALTAGLADPDPAVRAGFLEALAHLERRGEAAAPAVRPLLRDPSAEVRGRALDVLLRSAPRDDRLLADLATCLRDDDPAVQRRALVALRSLGPLGRVALPETIARLESPEPEVRRLAAEVIGSHGPAAVEAVPALGALLDDPEPEVRAIAAQTLGNLGRAARSELSRLTPLLEGQPVEVRVAAVTALAGLELDAEALRPHLAAALRAGEPDVRQAALRAIQRLGPEGSIFLPDLITLAADRDQRRNLERSLRRYERNGPDTRSIPELIEQLHHEHEAVRLLAARFLGLAGPKAREALSALEGLRDDPSEEVRRQAETSRERIAGGSDPG